MNPLIKFFVTILFTSSLSIISQAQAQAQPNYRDHLCQNSTTYTRNSTFQANLNLILSSLPSNATRSIGYYNTSAGQAPDNVQGILLCRGDVTPDACQNCVTIASQEIIRRCPLVKEAIIWYDECQVGYSNRSQAAIMDNNPTAFLWNPQNMSDPSRFNGLVETSMREVATQAANSPPGAKKFAVKEVNFTLFQKLYNLAQCTPDLSISVCDQCLVMVMSQLDTCCNGKRGGRVMSPFCNIRYEVYPFYNSTAVVVTSPPPSPVFLPPPPAGSGGSSISTTTIMAIVAPISVSVVLFCMGYIFLRRRGRKKYNSIPENNDATEITTVESLQIDLDTIETATGKFSEDNKLGEGGFGEVYKGVFPNGQEIAVKKLSRSSAQGVEQFKNEVVLLAKLQHRNLVRLLGFCLGGEEKILVYEFVPNKSLDFILFDKEKGGQLDWSKRYNIIGGIARGIHYLHEDSRLRIIHRDLKASNILLDTNMNPKISDFGMARIFGVDQTQANTSRIVGTYGYMSPEYAMQGQFSVKSDVYSFGVLVLEIICGKKNSSFYQTDGADDLLSYVWKHWRAGTPMEVLDPIIADSCSRNGVLRCIQIGLLCVQEDPAERPAMPAVVLMLNSYSVTIPVPQQPAFIFNTRSGQPMPIRGLESDPSSTKSVPWSVDEASITEVYPR